MNSPARQSAERGKAFEFQFKRHVEFCDTDMAGIMHFSNFFRFMEAAETAFYRSLGLSVLLKSCGVDVCLPRVHAECDYTDPLHFEDEVLVRLLIERKGKRSLAYQFWFFRLQAGEAHPVARGRVIAVCASRGKNGQLKAVALPGILADKLQQAPAQVLAAQGSWLPPLQGATAANGNGANREIARAAGSARRAGRKKPLFNA